MQYILEIHNTCVIDNITKSMEIFNLIKNVFEFDKYNLMLDIYFKNYLNLMKNLINII